MFLYFVLGEGLPSGFSCGGVSYFRAFRGKVVKILICLLISNHVEVYFINLQAFVPFCLLMKLSTLLLPNIMLNTAFKW